MTTASEITINRPFDFAEQTVENALLVSVSFPDGEYRWGEPRSFGVIHVYRGEIRFDKFEYWKQYSEGRMHFNLEGTEYAGAQESADMTAVARQREPFNRGSTETYIGYSFKNLDILPTANGSRFLSLKDDAWEKSLSTSIDEKVGRAGWLYSATPENLIAGLALALPCIGVPADDVTAITADIVGKVFPVEAQS